MPNPTPDWIAATDLLAGWMLTYLLHSSLLLGLVWLAARLLPPTALPLQETLWKTALLGGLATATLQLGLGVEPLAGSWSLDRAPEPVVERSAPEVQAPTRIALVPDVAVPQTVAPWSESTSVEIEAPSPSASPQPLPPASSKGARLESRWLGALWLAVGGLLLAALAVSELRFRRRLRGRRPVERGPLAALLAGLLARAGLARPVRLTATSRIAVPLARGVLRPEICVPSRAVEDLEPERQELVLAHELAHLQRRDPLWLLITRVIERLFFFQPLNLLARRRLQEIAEYRCDDWAVETTGRPVTLARCLAEVAEWSLARRRSVLAPSMAASPSRLRRRVERLLDRGYPRPADALPRWIVPAAAAVLVVWVLAAPAVTGAAWQGNRERAPEAPPAPEAPAPPQPESSPSEAPPPPEAPAAPRIAGSPGEAPPAPPAPPAPARPGTPVIAPLPPSAPTPGSPALAPAAPRAAEPARAPDSPAPAIAPRPSPAPAPPGMPRAELAPAPSAPLPPGFFISPQDLARLEALETLVAALSPDEPARWNNLAAEINEGVELESLEVERLNELVRRLSEALPGSEEWARWQAELNEIAQRIAQQALGNPAAIAELQEMAGHLAAEIAHDPETLREIAEEARRIAEQMRPDPEELERLHETARRMAEQSGLRREDLERLRIEMREVMEQSRAAREEARRHLEERRLEIRQELDEKIALEVSEERRRHLEMQREQLEARHRELEITRQQLEEVRQELERARQELRALHQERSSPPPPPEP